MLVEQCVCEGEGGGGACASGTVCLWGEGVVGGVLVEQCVGEGWGGGVCASVTSVCVGGGG